jgi:glutathione synthase/RimK-type ligase-like ATP-grasp enzyme
VVTAARGRARIAIATYEERPRLRDDDLILDSALRVEGLQPEPVIWNNDAVDWTEFDACLIRSTSDYHLSYDNFVAWIARVGKAMPIWNPVEMAIWNADKIYLRELAEDGVPTIPTHWIERRSTVRLTDVLDAHGWDEGVIKPTVGLGARFLHRVRGDEEGQRKLDELLEIYGVMVQPFLPTIEERGETSLIYIGGALTHVLQKLPKPGDFRVQGTWGGSVSLREAIPRHLEIAGRALAHLDTAPVYARVDIVDGPSGEPCLIELELLEPDLFFRQQPAAADLLARRVRALL